MSAIFHGPPPIQFTPNFRGKPHGSRRRVSRNKKYQIDRLHKHAPLSGGWPCGHRDNPTSGRKAR